MRFYKKKCFKLFDKPPPKMKNMCINIFQSYAQKYMYIMGKYADKNTI